MPPSKSFLNDFCWQFLITLFLVGIETEPRCAGIHSAVHGNDCSCGKCEPG